jgi:hypothetical protein
MIAEHLKTVERKVVAAALVAAENDVELAAKMLHLSVSELFDKKQTLGLVNNAPRLVYQRSWNVEPHGALSMTPARNEQLKLMQRISCKRQMGY